MDTPTSTKLRVHGMDAVVASPVMRALMRMVERVATTDVAVLITGETGCGKELIARAIHSYSARAEGPWVDVNCAALPEHLIESELFGYEKGAFSGAEVGKPGMFELAHKGTLFLDEVGELDATSQVKLLRVLDGMPFYRLGGNRKIVVDVRIIAATNQKLEEGTRLGRLRSDFYHRLSQFPIKVPPLRERPEDVIALAEYFADQLQPGVSFSFGASEVLRSYSWPGNVRELRNAVVQAVMKATGDEIRRADLPSEIMSRAEAPLGGERSEARSGKEDGKEAEALDELEKQAILKAMARTGGHQGMAAEALGVSRRTLSRRLKRYRVDLRPEGDGWRGVREQQWFRVALAVPVALTSARSQEVVTSVDVSLGGIGVEGVKRPFELAAGVHVSFQLPDDFKVISCRAHIVWANPFGRVGLRFVDMADANRERLERWLNMARYAQRPKDEEGTAGPPAIDYGTENNSPDERRPRPRKKGTSGPGYLQLR